MPGWKPDWNQAMKIAEMTVEELYDNYGCSGKDGICAMLQALQKRAEGRKTNRRFLELIQLQLNAVGCGTKNYLPPNFK
jgi:hypothetical protein